MSEEGTAKEVDVDLEAAVQNIKLVWVKLQDGSRIKMYKVTMNIDNIGNEYMNDEFKYSIKGPLTNKYETGSTEEISGQTKTIEKTTRFPEKQYGKASIQTVSISFYVNRKYLNKHYIVTLDSQNSVGETDENNNTLLINIAPLKSE